MIFRHKPTGALASLTFGAPRLPYGRKVGVVWHNQFNTVGSFTPAEFRAEFEPAPRFKPFCSLVCNRDYHATVVLPDTANHFDPVCLNCGASTSVTLEGASHE